MEIPIIKIGNSKGILLSKTLLDRYKLREKVEIVMKHNHLELRPIEAPREGWENKFKQMHEDAEDRLIIADLFEDEDSFEDDDLEEWK